MNTIRSRAGRAAAAMVLLVGGGAAWAVIGDGAAHAVPPDNPGVGPAGQAAIQITMLAPNGPLPGDTGNTFRASFMSWGVRVPVPTGGGGAGRPQFGEFVFRHDLGRGARSLFQVVDQGTRLNEVEIELSETAPDGRRVIYRYTLENAQIVRLQDFSPDSHGTAGSLRLPPQQEVAISYEDMSVETGD
jgi:type VI protein secretion system component Hcp